MFDIILTLIIWSLLGYIVSDMILFSYKGDTRYIQGFEYLNPMWLYKNFRVNCLGVVLLTALYNLLCPLGAMYYWLIKACTVGRK